MAAQFTRREVEARDRRDNAAIIIDNVVYDVTQFLEEHPGGPEVLLINAGRDASRCFHEVGHSEDAKRWRERFRVGEIVEGERWEVLRPPAAEASHDDPLTLSGLLNVWTPPLLMAAAAILGYIYIFS